MDLTLFFAVVIAVGVALYVVADGFDLGIGILFLFAPRDHDRDIMMESVAPVWDGNETWLVFGGTLLVAAFPIGYSVLLPAFYLPIMLMLFALILRGVAFEFRFQAGRSRRVWDFAFSGGSLVATLCQGFVLGGFIQGVPMQGDAFSGSAFSFLSILGALCGVGLVGGYALLGAGWLIWKTSDATQTFGREVGHAALLLTAFMMLIVSGWTALTEPEVAARWFAWPQILPLALLPLGAGLVSVLLWRSLWSDRDYSVFVWALILFVLGFGGLAVSLWPYVIPRHVTIWDGAADPATQTIIAVGVIIVLPFVVGYLAYAYWIFRGKATQAYDQGTPPGPPSAASRKATALPTDLHLS